VIYLNVQLYIHHVGTFMRVEKLLSPINGFNLDLLNDSDFKEDSVREEIILPIIKSLGYGVEKPNRIIRSKSLTHPYVSVGSARKKITCIPDYLFEVNDKYSWVLEAKSPSQNIREGKHVEQAYSYAIHSEIRVPIFALCNGKEFSLFHINEDKPLMFFNMIELPLFYGELKKYLNPENVLKADFHLAKDLGLRFRRLGFKEFSSITFCDVPLAIIGQLDNNLFTTATSTMKTEEGDSYVMSLDFNLEILHQLRGKIPDSAMEILLQRDENSRKLVKFIDAVYKVNLDCCLGSEIQENSDEFFIPFIVNRIVN
jgi:hypothetical protein